METLHFIIGPYYGFDWLGHVGLFSSIWLLGGKNKFGFIAGILSNIAFIAYSVMAQSIADPVGNTLLFILNLRGFLLWKETIS